MAMAAGAVVGGVAGYLFLTESGRRLRDQIEPRLDEAMREMSRLRQTIFKAQSVAQEGWRSLSQIASGGGEGNREWGSPRQSSPY
jgi:gas vesicle protein